MNPFMKKNFFYLLIFILSCFLTLLSFRWYVKIDYFLHNAIPQSTFLSFTFDNKTIDVVHFFYSDVRIKKYTFYPQSNGNIQISGINEKFLKIDINGTEIFNNLNRENFLERNLLYPHSAGEKLVISVTSQKNIYKKNFAIDDINITSLTITFLFYFFSLVYLFMKKELLSKIKKFFSKRLFIKFGFEFLFIILLWLVFFIIGYKFYVNVNHFENFMYETDVPYVIINTISFSARRFHPYFFFPFYPIMYLSNYIFNNEILSLGFIYSGIATFSCFFLYKTINLFLNKQILSLILVLIYAFCYAHLFFVFFFETYIVSCFFFSIIFYILSKICIYDFNIQKKNLIPLVILTALSFGVSISNLLFIMFSIITIFILKRYSYKTVFTYFLSTTLLILILFLFSITTYFSSFHHKNYTPDYSLKNYLSDMFSKEEISSYISLNIDDYYNTSIIQPIFAQKTTKNENWGCCINCYSTYHFQNASTFFTFLTKLFYCFIIFSIISLFDLRYLKKRNLTIFFITILMLLFLHHLSIIFWAPEAGFQFAINYLNIYFIIISLYLSKLLYLNKKNRNKIYYILLLIFSIYLILLLSNNLYHLYETYKLLNY